MCAKPAVNEYAIRLLKPICKLLMLEPSLEAVLRLNWLSLPQS